MAFVDKVAHHATPFNGFGAFGGSGIFGLDSNRFRNGGGGNDLFSRELIMNRRSEIASFEKTLAAARASYLTSLGNFYNNSFNRFAPQAEAMYAGRGLQVTGGAFQSALAKQAADYNASLSTTAYEDEREDAKTVEGLRQNLFGSTFDADARERGMKYQNKNENMKAIGGFAGQLGMMGVGYALGGPAGGMAASQLYGGFGNSGYEGGSALNLGYRPRRAALNQNYASPGMFGGR